MFRRILVPVDLGEKSLAAVDLARELASQSRAEVTLLHIVETIEHIAFDEMKQFYDRLEHRARQNLEELSEKFAEDKLKVDQAVVYGHRIRDIVDFAAANRSDLIVMASHRIDPDRPGHQWSSISYAVAMLAPCPVLLVK